MIYVNRKKQTHGTIITATLLIVAAAAATTTIIAQGAISAYAKEKEVGKQKVRTTADITRDYDQ
jgi:hypothetical protein